MPICPFASGAGPLVANDTPNDDEPRGRSLRLLDLPRPAASLDAGAIPTMLSLERVDDGRVMVAHELNIVMPSVACSSKPAAEFPARHLLPQAGATRKHLLLSVHLAMESENAYRPNARALRQYYSEPTPQRLTELQRESVCAFLFDVADDLRLPQWVAWAAMSYFDRYVEAIVSKRDVVKVSLTCLLVAAKYEHTHSPSPEELCQLADGRLNRADILNCEFPLLQGLGWKLGGPSPRLYIDRFVRLITLRIGSHVIKRHQLFEQSVHLACISALDVRFALQSMWHVAAAALICGCRTVLQGRTKHHITSLSRGTNCVADEFANQVAGELALILHIEPYELLELADAMLDVSCTTEEEGQLDSSERMQIQRESDPVSPSAQRDLARAPKPPPSPVKTPHPSAAHLASGRGVDAEELATERKRGAARARDMAEVTPFALNAPSPKRQRVSTARAAPWDERHQTVPTARPLHAELERAGSH